MRKLVLLALKIAVTAGLLYISLRGVAFASIFDRLDQFKPLWLLAGILVTVVQFVLAALRWRIVSAYCGVPLSLTTAMRYIFIGVFFSQTLPSSIGGDAVRLWLLGRSGVGWREATYSVLVDRAIGMLGIAAVIGLCLPWSYQLISDAHGRLALLAVDLAAIAGGIGFLVFGALRWPWLQRWWPTRHVHACAEITNRVLSRLRTGLPIVVLSLAIPVLATVIGWCVVRSISAPVTFAQTFLLIPPIILLTMLPISIAGWGVREATMMVAFGYAGLAPADGLIISLLYGITQFAVGALGGLVWILGREKMPVVANGETEREAS
jgi:uncharacterized membrane protein YbhN (UPF0104 family)